MMPGQFVDGQYREAGEFWAEPRCGQDFCDDCGDCLGCFGDDPCVGAEWREWHRWVVYADEAETFRQEMVG